MTHTITVCRSCAAGQQGLAAQLQQALRDQPYEIAQTDCMSGCTRASTVAFRAPGKTAYLFGDLTLADLADLVTFADLYLGSPDGNFVDARPLGTLRTKAIAPSKNCTFSFAQKSLAMPIARSRTPWFSNHSHAKISNTALNVNSLIASFPFQNKHRSLWRTLQNERR